MKTKLKKLWSGLLCTVLLMSLLPSTAFAADNPVTPLSTEDTGYELEKDTADVQITAENPGNEIQSAEKSSEESTADVDTNAQDTQILSENDESSTEAELDIQLANMPKAGADTYTFDSGVLTILASAGLNDWKTDTAFGSADITKLVVGSAVSEVAATEFRNCDNIKSIIFEGNINLTSCTDPENTSELLFPFENMKSLHNITFKGNANISDAFKNCAELEKVTFESTGRVGGYSLKECPKISSLTFRAAITLTDGALASDSSNPNNALTELVFPEGSEVKTAFSQTILL